MREHPTCLNCGGSIGQHHPDDPASCGEWWPSTLKPWTCTTCGTTVTGYRPGAFGPNGETPCAPCHNRAEAATLGPEVDPWMVHLSEPGTCGYCGRETRVRREPFGGGDACRSCWEAVCYGEGETA